MASERPGSAQFVQRLHTRDLPLRGQALRRHAGRGSQPFRPLPPPTGPAPYHLALADVLPPDQLAAITSAGRLVFHMVGDTGGVMTPQPQMSVAKQLEADCTVADVAARPAFFYHLGDVVYFYGEADQYYPQFYEPYDAYPPVIVAIPGNHDGDLSRAMQAAGVTSLAAFVDNFCQRVPHHTPEALDAARRGMTQPNVYWTLEAPFVTIVGLYTNVPDGGQLDQDQIAWLETELAQAPPDKALLLTMHHPLYSLDAVHSGSAYLHGVLDDAIARSSRAPDAIFTGHVHNYQRFTRTLNGRALPVVVAGGGGYHNLHTVVSPAPPPCPVPDAPDVTFESYCDNRFGYLKLTLTATQLTGDYYAVPGFGDPSQAQATHFDSFTLDLRAHTVTTNPVGT